MITLLNAACIVRSGNSEEARHRTIATPEEVHQFVAELYDRNATEAHLTHAGRPTLDLPLLSPDPVPDHEMFLQTHNGLGYIAYRGPNPIQESPDSYDPLYAVGEADSPEFVSYSSQHEFPRGTGLDHQVFTQIITFFLRTAELPPHVRWTTE